MMKEEHLMLPYKNTIPVAAHRGNSRFCPENTMAAFRSAIALAPDMIETDVHMTKDGVLVIMHDHKVDRTTDGTGLIREKTLEEMLALDAGGWKGEAFKGEKVPTFEEFCILMSAHPDILLNIELKDYPADSGAFAYESADKALAMMDRYGLTERSVVNTWSGELNEYLVEKYGDRIKIHAYYPQFLMGQRQKRYVLDYAYCVCLFGPKERPVMDKRDFDAAKAAGVEPWAFFPTEEPALYDAALEAGAVLFTANDPKWVMEYLKAKGLHE